MREQTPKFADIVKSPPKNWAPAYSNRAVCKEVVQLANLIGPKRNEGSTFDLVLVGDTVHLPFTFDSDKARRFRNVASQRELGSPFIVEAVIRSIDHGNKHAKPSAKIRNVTTGREVSLALRHREDCDALNPFFYGQSVQIFAAPLVEALGFDLYGGDLVFLGLVAQ